MSLFGDRKKNIFWISIIFFVMFFLGAVAEAKTLNSLGFAQNGIWYSTDKFTEGEKIKIYSVVFNSSAHDLLGAVEFFDNGISVGKSGFYVSGGGKIKEAGIDWVVAKGRHKISAKIKDAKIRMADGQEEAVILENSQTGISDIFVEEKIVIKEAERKQALESGVNGVPKSDGVSKSATSAPASIASSLASSVLNKSAVLIADSVKYVLKKTDLAAAKGGQVIERKKTETKQEIGQISNDSKTMERPLKSSYLLALSAASVILENKILFLLLVAAGIYILIKFVTKIISRRK